MQVMDADVEENSFTGQHVEEVVFDGFHFWVLPESSGSF
jgi:hypothetical protein